MNLADVLLNNVRRYPEKPVLVCDDTRLTYRDFNERCNRLGSALRILGVEKGDHLALLSKNCHRHFEIFFASAKCGFVFVPLNFRLSPRELGDIINDSEARVLFFSKEYLPVIDAIRSDLKEVRVYVCTDTQVDGVATYEALLSGGSPSEPETASIVEEQIVMILYTSGTTGYPKGAMISHRNRIADMIHQVTDQEYIEPEDTHLNVGPLYHIGALSQSQGHLYRGCTVVILREFDPARIFELVEKERVKTFWAAPTMLHMLINDPGREHRDLSCIKTITYAGSPMPTEVMRKAVEVFGKGKLIQFFGTTETGPQITRLPRKDHILEGTDSQLKRLRSVGIESQNVHVRIVDGDDSEVMPREIGEIVVKSDAVCTGYWKKPEETKESFRGGWYHTGDLGYMDEGRYLYIVDRKKDMIITGGENVYSAEVENVLFTYPVVSEAAVIGVPHEKWGETVKAVVVLKAGVSANEEEIIAFCRKNLASYKKPTSVEFVTELPKTPSGKVLKRELRDRYSRK
jgi:long-chain acyl-CoA synthetase